MVYIHKHNLLSFSTMCISLVFICLFFFLSILPHKWEMYLEIFCWLLSFLCTYIFLFFACVQHLCCTHQRDRKFRDYSNMMTEIIRGVKHCISCDKQQSRCTLVSSTWILDISPLKHVVLRKPFTYFQTNAPHSIKLFSSLYLWRHQLQSRTHVSTPIFLRDAISDILLPTFYLTIFLFYVYS